ncbi:MAG TPA: efflux RND transporter periplasmic adaptor subunit [Candidatus Cloacimonadota bacterium]|nr:efflux RND transporter periplasmic adaptor subunit [Candidatus Cloacimonadota bacterium]HPT70747.1 efflux RND transporter periplasmic adaptor subunit [Candidatus Cloacimonadota bacterium]
MSKIKKINPLFIIPFIVIVAIILFYIFAVIHPKPQYILGEIDATQVDVSSKIPGRIDSIYVEKGDSVTKGQVLARLHSPEIEAKVEQAKDAVESAKAMLNMALNGARPQDVKAAYDMYTAAKAQADFATKSYQRMKALVDKKSISKQAFDEMEAKYLAAKAQEEAAYEKWNMAKEGARKEEIEAARGNYERAVNTLKESQSYLDEITIKAPQNGEVDNLISDAGEMVAAGYPILSIVDLEKCWIVVYVSEDKLPYLKKGNEIKAEIPAIGKKGIPFVVSYISPVADFATKKATSEQGSFDLKSFQIQLTPLQPVDGLRPGMSARLTIPKH